MFAKRKPLFDVCVTGSAHPGFALLFAKAMGVSFVSGTRHVFPDGEVCFDYGSEICGKRVLVAQPTPTALSWIELFLMVKALKKKGADSVFCLMMYPGYGRQGSDLPSFDGGNKSGCSMIGLLKSAGYQAVFVLDPHHMPTSQGAENLFVHSLSCDRFFADQIRVFTESGSSVVIISPDEGRKDRAASVALHLGCPSVFFQKKRQKSTLQATAPNYDFSDKVCVVIDDIIDSGETFKKTADSLQNLGAQKVYGMITHGVFSKDLASVNLKSVEALYVTNSLPSKNFPDKKIVYLDIAPYLAEVISADLSKRVV